MSKATSAAVGTARAEQLKREAAAAVAAAEQRLAAFAVVAKAVARLAEVNDRLKQLDADLADHTARRDRVEAEVRAETGTPFAAALANLAADHAAATARLTADLHAATADYADKAAALAKVREQHAEAARKPGLLSRLFGGKPKPGRRTRPTWRSSFTRSKPRSRNGRGGWPTVNRGPTPRGPRSRPGATRSSRPRSPPATPRAIRPWPPRVTNNHARGPRPRR